MTAHEHVKVDGRRLGIRPADLNRPVLKLADILTGAVPDHPLTADHFTGVTWDIYGNAQFGVCGPGSVANIRRAITAILGGAQINPTLDDVYDLYRRAGNPDFDPETGAGDNGVVLADLLSALLKGGIGGEKPIAYAQVNVKDLNEVRAAVSIFGALINGVDLDVAQQDQTDRGLWDYVPRSASWGGHATPTFGYTSSGKGKDFVNETWGRLLGLTDAFWQHQVSESWVIIWREHLGTRQFQQGVDVAQLASSYQYLTGSKLVIPPQPDPFPTIAADRDFAGQLHAWLDTHPRANKQVQVAAETWLAARHL